MSRISITAYLKCFYVLIIICMGAATFVEKSRGTQFTAENIYDAWWFTALWAVLTAFAAVHFVRRRVRRASTVMLHLSFVIILAGALLTHLTAERGMVHLRQGETVGTYLVQDGDDVSERQLPFGIRLDRFEVAYHEGTTSAADYISHITITDGTSRSADGDTRSAVVSMNRIYSHRGVRLYQSDYDPDMQGSILALNADPWGIPVTYLGYALLFIAFLWSLADPAGAFRRLLRSPAVRESVLIMTVLMGPASFRRRQQRRRTLTEVREGCPCCPRRLPRSSDGFMFFTTDASARSRLWPSISRGSSAERRHTRG